MNQNDPFLPIPLSADLQRRLLSALKQSQLDLTDFTELARPASRQRLILDTDDFSAAELAQLNSLKSRFGYKRNTAVLTLTKPVKIALLKACQAGVLHPALLPELLLIRPLLKRDLSALSLDQLRLLAKASRLRRNGFADSPSSSSPK